MRRSTELYSHVVGGDTSHEKVGRSLEWVLDRYLANSRSCAPGISSLARQLGRDYAMVESFHSVGWAMTLQDAKWMFDLMAAQGINFYNVHAFYYTIDSITKHDAPPSQFFQNPYWSYYHLLGDYAGKTRARGYPIPRRIIRWPCWIRWFPFGQGLEIPSGDFIMPGKAKRKNGNWKPFGMTGFIWPKNSSFPMWDMICWMEKSCRWPRCRDGVMYLGKAAYSVLVIPPVTSMEQAVTEKLKEFVQSGGHVIAAGLLPYEIIDSDGAVEEEYRSLFGVGEEDITGGYWKKDEGLIRERAEKNGCTFVATEGSLKQAKAARAVIERIRGIIKEEIAVDSHGNREIYSSVRRQKDGSLTVFVGNHGRKAAGVTVTGCNTWHSVKKMNLEDGTIQELAAEEIGEKEGGQSVSLMLDGCESSLLLWEEKDGDGQRPMGAEKTVISLDLTNELPVTLKGKNIYRMDRFETSLDQRTWKETEVQTLIEACDAGRLLDGDHLNYSGAFGLPKRIQIRYPITVLLPQMHKRGSDSGEPLPFSWMIEPSAGNL